MNKFDIPIEQVRRTEQCDYDVVILGGAFSGASLGLLLKRKVPDLRVLIIEKTEVFNRKVGESSSEVMGCFLTKILHLNQHMAEEHLPKNGLRMWFHKEQDDCPSMASEMGPKFLSRFPTFQINRAKLDAHLIQLGQEAGCVLERPATIKSFERGGVGKNSVTYKDAAGIKKTVSAGWVVDASGKASLFAKKGGVFKSMADEHQTSAMWTRFTGVRQLDSHAGRRLMGQTVGCTVGSRELSTNHLTGYGWWCWIIPLGNGEVSAGLVWDQRLFTPPSGGKVQERVLEHLLKHPVGRVMFGDAKPVEGDNCYYKGLAYRSEDVAGDGWSTVGDACGFMDPLYSQGLDYCSHTVFNTFTIISDYYGGEDYHVALERFREQFPMSYQSWFEALYKDKYYYLGDAEIMNIAFLLDIATYFVGPVNLVYTNPDGEFSKLPYNGKIGAGFAKVMAFYNRRLVSMAKKKIEAGIYGDKNLNHDFLLASGHNIGSQSSEILIKGLIQWAKVELRLAFVKPKEGKRVPDGPIGVTPIPVEAG